MAPFTDPPSAEIRPRARIDLVDAARGVALVAMALYHLTWDLGFLQLTETNLAVSPPGRIAARAIAGSFLCLVGVSLVLAQGGGFRWWPFLVRLGRIAGAALLITVATWVAFPDSFIFFGILHAVAVGSVLALPFLRAPVPVLAIVAVLAFVAPILLSGERFDAPDLVWLGLGTRMPVTNDFVPVLPWFGCVLAGVAAARLALPRRSGEALARWRARSTVPRALAWAGRHSLAIYLIHQPVLLAVLYPVAMAVGPNPRAQAAPFLAYYEESCTRRGEPGPICHIAGRCLVERLKAGGLWADTLANTLSEDQRQAAMEQSRTCLESAKSP